MEGSLTTNINILSSPTPVEIPVCMYNSAIEDIILLHYCLFLFCFHTSRLLVNKVDNYYGFVAKSLIAYTLARCFFVCFLLLFTVFICLYVFACYH